MTGRRASQGGYALLIVLVAVGFFSILLVALLGLVDTDSATTSGFARTASERRAADAALQVAVTRVGQATSADLAAAGSCAGIAGTHVSTEGHDTTIECEAVASTDPPVASPGDGGTVLTLLGNYNGTLDDGVYNEVGGAMSPVVAGIAQWLNGLLLNGPGLVHNATDSLRLVGDVRVRQSTVALREPAAYPAIDVTGSYRQGDRGFLGGLDLGFFGSTKPCGVLSEDVGGVEYGLRLRSSTPPECLSGSAADRESVAPAAGPAVSPTKVWTPAVVAADARTVGACTSGTVKTFEPGSYNAFQTAIMNLWFQQGNGYCDDVTFWFRPGDYYFETTGVFDDDPRAIVFRDSSSNWVFGEPKGWSPPDRAAAANFPEACDRSADGVSLTLSSSTSLKHKAGRVAICGRTTSPTAPTIYQPPAPDNRMWLGEPSGFDVLTPGPGSLLFANPERATATIGPAPAYTPTPAGKAFDTSEASTQSATNNQCTGTNTWCAVSLQLTGFGNPADVAPSGPLGSAVVKIRGTAASVQPFNVIGTGQNVYTVVSIGFNDGSGKGCSVRVADVARSLTSAKVVDLLKAPGPTSEILDNSCIASPLHPAVLTDASQLQNAIVHISESVVVEWCGFFCTPTANVGIDYVWIEAVTASGVPPSPFGMVVAPESGTSMNIFGNVAMPRSQVEVKWAGTQRLGPVVVGSIVARGLASTPLLAPAPAGVLAARDLAPPDRRLRLSATIDGRVRGTAEVVVTDTDTTGTVFRPGQQVEVVDWTL